MHDAFVEPSKRYADVMCESGKNTIALDMVAARIRSYLIKRLGIQKSDIDSKFPNSPESTVIQK
jgi:uridine kinase